MEEVLKMKYWRTSRDGGSFRTIYTGLAKKFALFLELIYRTEIDSQTESKFMITEGKG